MRAKETAEKEYKRRQAGGGASAWRHHGAPEAPPRGRGYAHLPSVSRGTPLKRPRWKLGGDGDSEEGSPAEAGGLGDPPGCKCPVTSRAGLEGTVRVRI